MCDLVVPAGFGRLWQALGKTVQPRHRLTPSVPLCDAVESDVTIEASTTEPNGVSSASEGGPAEPTAPIATGVVADSTAESVAASGAAAAPPSTIVIAELKPVCVALTKCPCSPTANLALTLSRPRSLSLSRFPPSLTLQISGRAIAHTICRLQHQSDDKWGCHAACEHIDSAGNQTVGARA